MCINKNAELLPYYKKASENLLYNDETVVFKRYIKARSNYEIAGGLDSRGYIKINITVSGKQKSIKAHRLAWYVVYGDMPNVIDHINGDRTDNSIDNLRSCTPHQNSLNTSFNSRNTSGFRGVCWHKLHKKWTSNIEFEGKVRGLGYYDTPKQAFEVYKEKSIELFGEFSPYFKNHSPSK